jgi:hypothetical protein
LFSINSPVYSNQTLDIRLHKAHCVSATDTIRLMLFIPKALKATCTFQVNDGLLLKKEQAVYNAKYNCLKDLIQKLTLHVITVFKKLIIWRSSHGGTTIRARQTSFME